MTNRKPIAAALVAAALTVTPLAVNYQPQAFAQEPVNLLEQITPEPVIRFISEPVVQPTPTYTVTYDDTQLECIATAMYYEARGEPDKGKLAVGYVVLNRVADPRWPDTPCDVVSQPWQFSWYAPGKVIPENSKPYYVDLAKKVVFTYNGNQDVIGVAQKATHFHASYVSPRWGKRLKLLQQIGLHRFYE